jgi:hypothetical protein
LHLLLSLIWKILDVYPLLQDILEQGDTYIRMPLHPQILPRVDSSSASSFYEDFPSSSLYIHFDIETRNP